MQVLERALGAVAAGPSEGAPPQSRAAASRADPAEGDGRDLEAAGPKEVAGGGNLAQPAAEVYVIVDI